MPRVGTRHPRPISLLDRVPLVTLQTQKLHSQCLTTFIAWLRMNRCLVDIDKLVAAPAVLDLLLLNFGRHLFVRGMPEHHYRYCLTGLQKYEISLRHQIPRAWSLMAQWEATRDIEHRTPLPTAVYRAMISIAVAWEWIDWAVVTIIAFMCPARIGEPLAAIRRAITLPLDTLMPGARRVLFMISRPKTRNRGPRVQHTSVCGITEVNFLSWALGRLQGREKVYPCSNRHYRECWDIIMQLLLVPPHLYTPGGLRGGGAIAQYLSGASVPDVQWQMRLQSQSTLSYYLQEAAAVNSLLELSDLAKVRIRAASALYVPVLHSAFEAAPPAAP